MMSTMEIETLADYLAVDTDDLEPWRQRLKWYFVGTRIHVLKNESVISWLPVCQCLRCDVKRARGDADDVHAG